MKREQGTIIWGIVLVVVGLLFLLQTFGFLEDVGDLVWGLAFALGGIVFTSVFIGNRARWWAIIPGLTLLGLGALIGIGALLPSYYENLIGAPLFLASISAAFWTIYLTQRRLWWAIIPGGVMASVAAVAFLDALPARFDSGWVMMLGLSATFAIVATVRSEQGPRMTWALIPAGVLGLIGLALLFDTVSAVTYIVPVGLVLAGLYFVWRSVRSRPKE